ncbi:hypothetical protein [Streptomyces sp. MAI_2237]
MWADFFAAAFLAGAFFFGFGISNVRVLTTRCLVVLTDTCSAAIRSSTLPPVERLDLHRFRRGQRQMRQVFVTDGE